MPSHVVVLTRLSRSLPCCGQPAHVYTAPTGTVSEHSHARRCRVGRVLRQPADMHRPGFEPLPVDDRHVLRRALA